MSRQGPDCAAHPRARGSACASAHPPESHWDSCKTPQFDPNMIPQNRRIVKWEIRRLPYKGGIGRAILPPVLPFMVCTQLPAHGHCFYVHGLLTALTHPVTGCTGSATGKIAVYLQFVCGMLPIFFTNTCGFVYNLPQRASRGFPACRFGGSAGLAGVRQCIQKRSAFFYVPAI